MNILGLDSSSSIGFEVANLYSQREHMSSERASQDSISISEEAKVLFMQSQVSNASTDSDTGSGDEGNSPDQQFKNILNEHKSGGSSSQSSSEDAIEDVVSQIKQVSSELASAASKEAQTSSGESSSRVQQLESQLGQLESLLAELEAAATEEATS